MDLRSGSEMTDRGKGFLLVILDLGGDPGGRRKHQDMPSPGFSKEKVELGMSPSGRSPEGGDPLRSLPRTLIRGEADGQKYE